MPFRRHRPCGHPTLKGYAQGIDMTHLVPLIITIGLAIAFHQQVADGFEQILATLQSGGWDDKYVWWALMPGSYLLGLLLLRDRR